MKLSYSLFCLASAFAGSAAFVAPAASAPTKSVSSLAATVESTRLIPPRQISDMSDSTQDMYDSSVQKTYGRYPLTISHGKGCHLFTTDGKDYLDCVSGIATCALGHANEELCAAINKQMSTVHHVSNLYFIPQQAALADWLCQNSNAEKVFFCNSGAEANEAAIKCARRHASNRGIGKPVIITAEQSFHGRTLAALTATAQPKYHKGFGYDGKMISGFEHCVYNDIASLEAAVEKATSNGQGLAAIMLEPLQGEGGIKPGKADFFARARELCDQHGALLMCDEVQVGMGRSGTLWGHEQLDVIPDVFTSAKALGGGVPIGAMMARGDAATTFGPGDHASTYGGNPLACAAGLAVAQYMYDNNTLQNVQQRGEQLTQGLETLAKKYPSVLGEVRGWGLLKGVECIKDGMGPGDLVAAAMEQGLLLVPAGYNVVRFVPPLIVSKDEIDMALERFEAAVKAKST